MYWWLCRPNDSKVSRLSLRTSTPSRAMKRENFLLLSKYASGQPALKLRQTLDLYVHDISLVYEDVTRFRQHLLLTQNGMTPALLIISPSPVPYLSRNNYFLSAFKMQILYSNRSLRLNFSKTVLFWLERRERPCPHSSAELLIVMFTVNPFNPQIEAIKRGLLKVLSQAVLDLLTWQELERRVCGDPELSVEALKKCSEFVSRFYLRDQSHFRIAL